jgi:hypothetical protein
MDCQENGMFYQVQKNGDWISSNSDMYNDFLGIGSEGGFLGYKKVIHPKGKKTTSTKQVKVKTPHNFLGIGTEGGFLGLRKVLYPKSYQMRYGRKQKIEPIKSIGLKPLKVDYGTPTPYTPKTFNLIKVPTGLNAIPKEDREDVQKTSFLSTLFGGQLDNLLNSAPIPNFNEPKTTPKPTQETKETSSNETKVVTKDYNLEDARAKLKQLEEDGKDKNKTLLYVGLASVGVLLIGGFAYMSSKGK